MIRRYGNIRLHQPFKGEKEYLKNKKIDGKIIPQNSRNSFIMLGLLILSYLLFVALFFFKYPV